MQIEGKMLVGWKSFAEGDEITIHMDAEQTLIQDNSSMEVLDTPEEQQLWSRQENILWLRNKIQPGDAAEKIASPEYAPQQVAPTMRYPDTDEIKVIVPQHILDVRDMLLEQYADCEPTPDTLDKIRDGWAYIKAHYKLTREIFDEPKKKSNAIHNVVLKQEKEAVGRMPDVITILKLKLEQCFKDMGEAAPAMDDEFADLAVAATQTKGRSTEFRNDPKISYKVHNPKALVDAVAAGTVPIDIISFKERDMQALLKTAVNPVSIPGVLIDEEKFPRLRLSNDYKGKE